MSRSELSTVVRARTVVPTSVWMLHHPLSSAASSRATTQTRDRDGSAPIPSDADPSCGSNSSKVDPPAVEGVGDVDAEAYPIATSAKDATGVPSFVYPAIDTATCMDDGSGYAASSYDIMATPGCATSSMGAPDMPSSVRSPMHAAIS